MGAEGSLWQKKLVKPERVISRIRPGMSIFLGTGISEPRTLVKALMGPESGNLQDLELIQLVSLGDAISIVDKYAGRFRLKTFFAGWVASEAIATGRVDLIPTRFSRIPSLIESGTIKIDVAFVQITPPDAAGHASLGVSVDVARQAMEKASLVVGEINDLVPRTLGDTTVHVDEFDYLVPSTDPPITFGRWPVDDVHDRVGENVASLIEDGSCLAFSIGPLYEAVARHLTKKRHLGIHTPFFTDAVMELVKSGAVTNRRKGIFKGKCLTAYALGTPELMRWLDRNPLIEFQGIDVVADPKRIGSNDRFIGIHAARKVDLTGGIALHAGKGNVSAGPAEAQEFYTGVGFSAGGHNIVALPSRNLKGRSNILLSVEDFPNPFCIQEGLDLVVTEYGVAALKGRTVRERAQALIDIAHPDDRAELVRLAKERHILYADQVYLAASAHLYPGDVASTHTFKDGTTLRFRAIKPSDEEGMRSLFYRFSDQSVYYRYFSPIKAMPHAKMQEYVNVDYVKTMSIVGLIGPPGEGKIVAEARYVRLPDRPYADVAFVVDEDYQGRGVATYLFLELIRIARDRGIEGFTAEVLATNRSMLKVFEKSPFSVKAVLNSGVYELTIPFKETETME